MLLKDKRAALHSLGCKVNSYETQMMEQRLMDKGCIIVPFTETADIYVINTCSVTAIADRKSRQMLNRAKALNPEAIVVACGCYVETATPEVVAAMESVDIVIGNDKKQEIVSLLEECLQNRESEGRGLNKIISAKDINERGLEFDEFGATMSVEHTRAFMKIQDGCNQFCTYCIIPYARGRIRSRKKDSILAEAKKLAELGFKEVVLTGIHLTSYGLDLPDDIARITLVDVVEELSKIDGIERIRLGSLEPGAVDEEFASRLGKVKKLCPHFHMSLQSGSDGVLKRMNRHYTTAEFEHSVGLLREHFENPAITTDVIAGFPGETETEHQETVEFIKKIAFSEMHIFPYSRRKGTVADKMAGQLTEAEKKKRANELIDIAKGLTENYINLSCGRKSRVLLEECIEIDGKQYMTGFTPEYIKVEIPMDEAAKILHLKPQEGLLSGEIIEVELSQDILQSEKLDDN